MHEKIKKRGRKPKETPEGRKREILEIVDKNCNPVSISDRESIHKKGFFHKIIHIFLFNENGEIYLQKKSPVVDENPGLWTSSASGHVLAGEGVLISAQRELKEELSIKVKLKKVLKLTPSEETNMQCISLFVGYTKKIPKPNPLEIEEGRFFTIEEVENLLQTNPEIFSSTFRFLWRKYWESVSQTGHSEK
uniref:NUDIX domain-containing protein n=1 Tax=Thermodesulfobacterium geofontis TaxID=1295609 RepID=A0A7V6CE77_9BACT